MTLRSIALFSLMSIGILTLSGCGGGGDGGNSSPPTGYEITSWSAGKAVGTWNADSYAAEGGNLSFHEQGKPADQNQQITGTWVVKHRAWKPAQNTRKYKATLYSGNQAVGSWDISNFSTGHKSVLLYPADGSEVLRVCGNVVIQEVNNGTAGDAHHRVTLSENGNVVYSKEITWYNRVGENYIQAQPADGSGIIYIWGDFQLDRL